MIVKKKKEWDRDLDTWGGRFYVPGEYRDKIPGLLKKKKL
jgi:hypothetical protein